MQESLRAYDKEKISELTTYIKEAEGYPVKILNLR